MKKRVIALFLAVMMTFMTACAGQSDVQSTSDVASTDEVQNADTTEPAADDTAGDAADDAEAVANTEELRYAPEWTKDTIMYEVNIRQYTEEGTFNAFAEHLPTLKDMGVTVLWIMPIHPISVTNRSGVLGSYYSITDYCAVNPEFGTAEDFKALVDKAHELGIKVMMDWVANHTGWDSAWIDEHPEWYTQDASGNIISPEGMGWPDVADLNYDNQEMRAEMIECMKYWIVNYDVDGFRCDYATGVPKDFWEDARKELEQIKPMYMLAEDNMVESLLDEAFDFNYNWDLYEAMLGVAKDSKKANILKIYVPENENGTYALNFMDNHDKNSWERTIMGAFGADVLPAMYAFLYTIPGAPLIYTGDEIGLDHQIAFMEKDAVDWNSSEYDYRPILSALGKIRSNNPALYCGNYGGAINYYDVGNKNIFSFYREKDGNCIKCVYNLSKREQTIDVSEIVKGSETVLLQGCGYSDIDMTEHPISEENFSGEVTMQPWEFWILLEEE